MVRCQGSVVSTSSVTVACEECHFASSYVRLHQLCVPKT
jgi:hypothetical protein